MGFLLAPGTGPSRFWGFGVEIEAVPALRKPTVIYLWDGKGTGELAVVLCSGVHTCWVFGSRSPWLRAQRKVLKGRISRELAR